jgi:hypothetical protein
MRPGSVGRGLAGMARQGEVRFSLVRLGEAG